MHRLNVLRYSFYFTCAMFGFTIIFDYEIVSMFGVDTQILMAALGSMILGVFIDAVLMLHEVLVIGEKHLAVSEILRKANLYQMEE